jgi:8-oxo-dGTP pyrophosphatase MutT (NUDIX family)
MLHPRKNDEGQPVLLKHPSKPSTVHAWLDPTSVACVIPDGELPNALNNIPFLSIQNLSSDNTHWETLAASMPLDEPPFHLPAGLKASAGVVICEMDGRCWLIAPSNQFGGYQHTFPKGRLDGKSLKAAALAEAFEECGLQVVLTSFLVDAPRSTTYTRYYMAKRVAGNPAEMGWESQAVILAPIDALSDLLNNNNDKPVLAALKKYLES